MSKRQLQYQTNTTPKQAKVYTPLSLNKVTAATADATISGILTSLSPLLRWGADRGSVCSAPSLIRQRKRQYLQALADYNIPITIKVV